MSILRSDSGTLLTLCSIFGRILPGFAADRLGRFNAMIVTTYSSAILVLALWLPARANAPVIVFAALYGFTSGAFVSLAPALVAQISDIRKIGVRTGSLFAIISFAALVGNPIGGSLVTRDHGKFTQLQIFGGVMMMGGATIFVFARTVQVGFALNKRV